MAIDSVNNNIFAKSSGLQAISSVNPFSGPALRQSFDKKAPSDNQYGVGLVNSSLSNMSYVLPNGKTTTCNTIGIG